MDPSEEERHKSDSILESIGDPISIQDADFRILYQNSAHKKVFGDHAGDYCYRKYRQKDNVCEGCPLAISFESGLKCTVERSVPGPEGTLHFEVTAAPLRDSDDRLIGGVEVIRDITARKKSEKELQLAHAEFEQIFNTAADGMRVIDRQYRALRVNKKFSVLSGVDKDEAVGKKCYEIFPGPTCHTAHCPLRRILKGEQHVEYEVEKTRLDGTVVPCILTATPFKGPDGELIGIVENFKDITERRTAEQELLKAQKLESVGILAGGIAHDFNNLLTGIMGNISLAKIYAGPNDKVYKLLLEAEKSSLRARDLTSQLLTFSRGGAPVKRVISPASLIREAALFSIRGSDVRCNFSFSKDLWPVEVDLGQIGQVITNLVMNSQQAMPGGGVIEVSCENTFISPDGMLPLKDGRYVRISVRDNGTGISKDHLEKIFDPYFTTRQGGTGLGLAIVYSIIKRHDGHITVRSERGAGTVFDIHIPASDKVRDAEEEKAEEIFRGRGRILVMDDEEAVRLVAAEMLKSVGYESEVAADGNQAIESYRRAMESHNPFSAVIIDLTVPGGMGGKETIKRLREIDPEVRAIVSSGYSDDEVLANFGKYGFKSIVTKPYNVGQLSKVLHQVISS